MRHQTLTEILVPRVEAVFHRHSGPIFAGEVSNEIGYNLEYTLEAIDLLVARGSLRHATDGEIRARSGAPGSNVFAMTTSASLGKAYAP